MMKYVAQHNSVLLLTLQKSRRSKHAIIFNEIQMCYKKLCNILSTGDIIYAILVIEIINKFRLFS